MAAHSAILGGSNAERLLNCNASYQESLRAPIADLPSVYAQEGTDLHARMTAYLTTCGLLSVYAEPAISGDISLTDDHRTALLRCFWAIDELKARYGGRWRIVALETAYAFPGVLGSFGTVDLVITNGKVIVLIDWKFGTGVPVRASYEIGGEVYLNAQLMYYAIAVRAARKRLFRDKLIVIVVCQPRAEEDQQLSYAEVDNAELDDWQGALNQAYLTALDRNPEHVRGPWCQFAVCKSVCPLWIGGLHELGDLDLTGNALFASIEASPNIFGTFLGRALTVGRFAEQWAAEVQRQAHLFASDGHHIPGWRLVPKRGTRAWAQSEDDTVKALVKLGAPEPDLYTEPELKSPFQVEKVLKKRKLKLPDGLAVMVSSGDTLAPEDDPRPTIDHRSALHELGVALEALK
jgi:hypothetical protein